MSFLLGLLLGVVIGVVYHAFLNPYVQLLISKVRALGKKEPD